MSSFTGYSKEPWRSKQISKGKSIKSTCQKKTSDKLVYDYFKASFVCSRMEKLQRKRKKTVNFRTRNNVLNGEGS